jgi:hypothetical protein
MILQVKYPINSVLGLASVTVITSLPASFFEAVMSEITEKAGTTCTSGSEVSKRPATRFNEYTTSSAVTVSPLWNFTPSRNTNVYFVPSAEMS